MLDPLLAHLLDAASRAPSAHNTQPWRLRAFPGGIDITLATDRLLPVADASGNDALHAVGAALENLVLTLAQHDRAARYDIAEHPLDVARPVVTLRWQETDATRPDPTLYRMIPIRRTSRLPYRPDPVPAEALAAMRAAAAPCRLCAIDDGPRIDALRRTVVEATVTQLADDAVGRELYAWLRFSRRDPRWYRDGLNAACMGWSGLEAAIVRRLLAPGTLRVLSRLGLHRVLAADVNQQAPPAPLIALLTTPSDGVARRVEAGRALQRVWLTAAAHGLVTHPLSAAIDVEATRPRALALFDLAPDERPVNLFRLGFSAPPARSVRLPVDELLEPMAVLRPVTDQDARS
jgi:nitroreductase